MQYGITDQKDPFTWKNYLVFMYVSQLGISSPKEPTLNWMRIVFWIVSFLGYIILNLYQNYIGAFLAIPHFRPPVTGLEEIMDYPYKLSISEGSSVEKYFHLAENGSIQNQLLMNNKLVLHTKDTAGIEQMLKGNFSSKFYGKLGVICYICHSFFHLI